VGDENGSMQMLPPFKLRQQLHTAIFSVLKTPPPRAAQLHTLFALTNLWMTKRKLVGAQA
jgi:hypothetical protein